MPLLRNAVLASLACNLGLAGAYWLNHRTVPPAPAAPKIAAAVEAEPTPPPATAQATDIAAWLNDPGLADETLVARLRAAGLPPESVRALISSRLHRRHAARWQAIAAAIRAEPYWQRKRPGMNLQQQQAVGALTREHQADLVRLLGDDAVAGTPGFDPGNTDFLSPAKRFQVSQVLADFAEIRQAYTQENAGITLPQDREVLALLLAEQEAELATLLTPEELAEYRIRSSPAARSVQTALRQFEASEEEYLALLERYVDLEQRLGPEELALGRNARAAHAKAWRDEQAAFAASLPPERAEEWAVMTDGQFTGLDRLVVGQGLTSDTTAALIRLSRDINRQAETVRADTTLTSTHRELALQTLAAQAQQGVEDLLPAAAREEYLRRYGRWVTRLQPAPARTPAPTSSTPTP